VTGSLYRIAFWERYTQHKVHNKIRILKTIFNHTMNGEVQTDAFSVPDFNLHLLQNQYIYCLILKGNTFKKHTVRCINVTPTETVPTAQVTGRRDGGAGLNPLWVWKGLQTQKKIRQIKSQFLAGSELLA
jgi:hypothetical protein